MQAVTLCNAGFQPYVDTSTCRRALRTVTASTTYGYSLAPLASHYAQTSVSMFAALLPLVAHPDGVDLVEYTQDGTHSG